ncbi:SDR family oxidoreductase [Mangrovimicrobium sediminis]|uniref:SDR family oxidoreductase n=1 Tax=Mangrovimicrobium sediminis TaxID=2562682 RepID=A0A4Z0LUZ3_9GAMM|nr:SDR family oxidoreductase [Haliea sp. SAOS-164]TGD71100.1 SDR family oxidoreductase [Haliea sp. SAOS-164]
MPVSYKKSVVVVTGASTGLGRAIASGAANTGALAVVINYANNPAPAEQTAEMVRSAGAEAIVVQGNVAEEDDCQKIIASAQPYGRIDALFNNAGVARDGDFNSYTAEDFLYDYRVNVIGAFQMARAARPLLEASDRAAIVNTASVAGLSGIGTSPSYTASKAGMIALGQWLAREMGPRIRVNNICPGFIDTEWFQKQAPPGGIEKMRERVSQSGTLQRVAVAEDVADVALFLGSPAARHMTGESLKVSG